MTRVNKVVFRSIAVDNYADGSDWWAPHENSITASTIVSVMATNSIFNSNGPTAMSAGAPEILPFVRQL